MKKSTPYYSRHRRKGRLYSAGLHALFLLVAFFGLPSLLSPTPPEEPSAIVVDIVPVAEMTNVPVSENLPEQPKSQPKSVPKREQKPEPKPEQKPEQKAEVTLPAPKTPEPKPKPKPPKPKPKLAKPKTSETDFTKLLNDMAKHPPKPESHKPDTQASAVGKSNRFDPSQMMTVSEVDMIRSQIAKCWNFPAGAPRAEDLKVTLRIKVEQTGVVTEVELSRESRDRYNQGDSFFRTAAESALRAVRECSPLRNLPPEKYQTWRDMEFTFDPKDVL